MILNIMKDLVVIHQKKTKTMNFKAVINELNENGVVKLDSYFDEKTVSLLNQEYDQILLLESKGLEFTPYSNGQCARITSDVFDFSPFPITEKVFFSELFKRLSEEYLSTKRIFLNEQIFVVKDIVGTKHLANDLHYDVVKTFKFFIYLADTTTENGAFTCVPKSHKKTAEYREKFSKEINYENRDITRKLDLHLFDDPIPIEGKAGSLIIFDTDTWHKAGIVTKGERRVMRGHTRGVKLGNNTKKGLFRRLNLLKSK